MNVVDLLTESDQSIIIHPGFQPQDRDARFELACQLHPNAQVEMDERGNIIVTPGSSGDSGFRSGEAFRQLANWARNDGSGRAFDATTNFNLPSGAKRQPDAAWVPKSVLQQEGPEKLRTITKTRHVPDFLIEVASPSDSLAEQKLKCDQWIGGGVKEAVLLHPETQTAFVYRSDGSVEEIPNALNVESRMLTGFVLDCSAIWEDLA